MKVCRKCGISNTGLAVKCSDCGYEFTLSDAVDEEEDWSHEPVVHCIVMDDPDEG